MDVKPMRLTEMAHGGGCGCKLSPAVLRDILAKMPVPVPCPDLLVGTETSDDAAVYRLNATQAIVATTDFFTPVVDDPFAFGRIAATNALSDVYAMGGTPLFALALVGMPVAIMPVETVQDILAGGASICAEAGVPVVGGHSIDTPEPIYGLVAIGLVHPQKALRNAAGRPGDALVLTKGLGVGIFSAALKKDALPEAAYDAMIASTTTLNRVGAELSGMPAVHAMTDVTGFGLLGHLLEICHGSGLAAEIKAADAPLLEGANALAEAGFVTGASTRNWASYGDAVRLPNGAPPSLRALLTDPQTSGGLLIACAAEASDEIVALCKERGHAQAAVIGRLVEGAPGVTVL